MIKVRKINENDPFLIEKLINIDPDHAGKSKVDFWLPQDRTNCFAVEDEIGTIFYVRAENVLRLHVQFDTSEKERTKKALDIFAAHIRETAKPTYKQIIFESTFAPLIGICRNVDIERVRMNMSLICRQVVPEDEALISEWLERDETHKAAGIKWKDIIAPCTYAEIVLDEDGVILTVVRYHGALRAAMQFNPEASYRIAKHGKELKEMLEQRARNIGALEVIIRPGGNAVRFADKLGFVDFTGSKIVRI